ncbi:hypothetical protein MOV08_15840 [Streptomyces yunnanensis]|uniref:Uncharacterized protein n=1 Tax=Streptomyces yunnanensis TaxID=156453 RepID=A0ABY8A6M2_9ACTN|nr:hypothetical protein [Streptomyces yunnanensis]WEB40610.1 hypothetical protein MOV08_15840 [Streptomyces yunnanensis]
MAALPVAWERCWQALEQALGPAPADASAAARPGAAHRCVRLLDRRWIAPGIVRSPQVTAESSMFRFNV